MGSLWSGIRATFDRNVLKAVWNFNRDFVVHGGNMPEACQTFLERADYPYQIERPWHTPPAGVLFVADHAHLLDGFALSLACPAELELRRTIFLVTALLLGRDVARRSLLVWPKGKWHGLLHEARGFKEKLTYLCTHRWGPWVKPSRALNTMCQALGDGICLTLLPSGMIGDTRWRSGVGAILARIGEQPSIFASVPYLAPVYLTWSDSPKSVCVTSPGIIRMDRLYAQAQSECQPLDRTHLSQWLERQYVNRSWVYEQSPSQAPSS
jgi:hypothetical protein